MRTPLALLIPQAHRCAAASVSICRPGRVLEQTHGQMGAAQCCSAGLAPAKQLHGKGMAGGATSPGRQLVRPGFCWLTGQGAQGPARLAVGPDTPAQQL